MNADGIFDLVTRGIISQSFADRITIEDRPLTIGEWWGWKVRHKGDPRVHYEPIELKLYDAGAGLAAALRDTKEANAITIQWCKVHNKQSHDPHYCWPAIDVDGVDCQVVNANLVLTEDK